MYIFSSRLKHRTYKTNRKEQLWYYSNSENEKRFKSEHKCELFEPHSGKTLAKAYKIDYLKIYNIKPDSAHSQNKTRTELQQRNITAVMSSLHPPAKNSASKYKYIRYEMQSYITTEPNIFTH
jgi:hypothetical protein